MKITKKISIGVFAVVFSFALASSSLAADMETHKAKVKDISSRLEKAAGFPLKTAVTDDARHSAFLLPDGTIQLTRGIIASCESDDEVAFVLAHEAAHLQAREYPGSISGMSSNETRADLAGIMIMKKAGYNPLAALKLLTRLSPDSSPFFTRRIDSIYEFLLKELPK